jgi:hypothetical protein
MAWQLPSQSRMKKVALVKPPQRLTWQPDWRCGLVQMGLKSGPNPAGGHGSTKPRPAGNRLWASTRQNEQIHWLLLLTESPPPSVQRMIRRSVSHENLFFVPGNRAAMIEATRILPTLMANESRLVRALAPVSGRAVRLHYYRHTAHQRRPADQCPRKC